MKPVLVHDWLLAQGGAERVLEAIHALYPAPVYTLLCKKKRYEAFQPIFTSFLQYLPYSSKYHRHLLPLYPLALKQFDLRAHDLILSSSFLVAKSVKKNPSQLHICYCHTPMRYAWDLYAHYMAELSWLQRIIASAILSKMRAWDVATAAGVDHFIANSFYVAKRIQKIYGRDAKVIYPPVRTTLFTPRTNKEQFYLTASRLVSYKKVDLIVKTFSTMPDKKLIVVGDGPEMQKIKKQAGSNIELLGWQPDAVVRDLMQRAKAFVFAAEEDFGITPVEAQAAGTPVIAYGVGGVTETVIPGVTGLFFDAQTECSLRESILTFERSSQHFDPLVISKHARQFDTARFNQEFTSFVEEKYESYRTCGRPRP
jgi:glycosyltransferase involved in cell wall biosynthesis